MGSDPVVVEQAICGAGARAARREAARAGEIGPLLSRDDWSETGARSKRLRKEGAIRSASVWSFAEPGPERPAAKRQEREK